jgi:hypothetical protein
VALLVNNLGATTPLEMQVAAAAAAAHARRQLGVTVQRLYCGRYMTSLDMHGLSLTLMRLDDATLALLDAPTEVLWQGQGLSQGPGSNSFAWLPLTLSTHVDLLLQRQAGRQAGRVECLQGCVGAGSTLDRRQDLPSCRRLPGPPPLLPTLPTSPAWRCRAAPPTNTPAPPPRRVGLPARPAAPRSGAWALRARRCWRPRLS